MSEIKNEELNMEDIKNFFYNMNTIEKFINNNKGKFIGDNFVISIEDLANIIRKRTKFR